MVRLWEFFFWVQFKKNFFLLFSIVIIIKRALNKSFLDIFFTVLRAVSDPLGFIENEWLDDL